MEKARGTWTKCGQWRGDSGQKGTLEQWISKTCKWERLGGRRNLSGGAKKTLQREKD